MPIWLQTSAFTCDCCNGWSKKVISSLSGLLECQDAWVKYHSHRSRSQGGRFLHERTFLQYLLDCLCCALTVLILLFIPSWPSHLHCKPPLFILSTIFLMFLLSLSLLNNQPCLKYQCQLDAALPAAATGVAAHKDKFRLCFGLATWGWLNFTQVHQNAESAPACKRVSFYSAYVHLQSIKTQRCLVYAMPEQTGGNLTMSGTQPRLPSINQSK